MEYWFSAHETAELAAGVEEKGSAFYRRLAVEVQDATVRNMCEFFAGQEDEHRDAFRDIADHFRGKTVEFPYALDIRTMLHVSQQDILALFSKHGKRLLDGGGAVGCLNLARRIEETSVAVYGHMRQTYTDRFAMVLARIVAEEEKHLRMVKDVLSKM